MSKTLLRFNLKSKFQQLYYLQVNVIFQLEHTYLKTHKFLLTMKLKYSFDIQNGKNKNLICIIDMPVWKEGLLCSVQLQKPMS